MLFLTLSMSSLSHAEPAPTSIPVEACGAWLEAAFPANNAVEVPVDVAPAYLLRSCPTDATDALVVVTGGGVVVFSELVVPPASSVVFGTQAVDLPQLELEPDTVYTVEIEGESYVDAWSFTTGEGLATGPAEVPTLQLDDAFGWVTAEGFHSSFSGLVSPRDTFVRLVSVDLATPVAFAFGYVGFELEHPQREVCFTPEVRGEDGTWLAGEEECITIEEVDEPIPNDRNGTLGWLGCSSSGAAGLFLGPLPLLLLRRRRHS